MRSHAGSPMNTYHCSGEADSCGLWFVGRDRKTDRQRMMWRYPAPDEYLAKRGRRRRATLQARHDDWDLTGW
jgi:hypothetical protein